MYLIKQVLYNKQSFRCGVTLTTSLVSSRTEENDVDMIYRPDQSAECQPYTEAKIQSELLTNRLKERAGTAVNHPKLVIANELGRVSSSVRNG